MKHSLEIMEFMELFGIRRKSYVVWLLKEASNMKSGIPVNNLRAPRADDVSLNEQHCAQRVGFSEIVHMHVVLNLNKPQSIEHPTRAS
jgi:hypothetical protein